MFPYAIASTCTIWRDVMLSVPRFWRHLVILVDSPATPLSAIASHLSWSRDQPLDITITRRWGSDNPVDGRLERSRIIAIMNILDSHLHLIRELCFDVMFSSSLPSFPYCFRGSAPILKRLELRCKEDDGGHDSGTPIHSSITEHEQFQCPELTSLVIDGRNYYEACNYDATWMDDFSSVVNLTISRFKPCRAEWFSIRELLLPLTALNIDTLCVSDVALHRSHEAIPLLARTTCLDFEDMHDFWIMDRIIHGTHVIPANSPFCISFTRCTFAGIFNTSRHVGQAGVGGDLILAEMDKDMVPFLRVFKANELEVLRCPSFNDIVLDAMGSEENGSFPCATYIRTLSITNCLNFSVAALRRLVESRLHLPPENNDQWNPTTTRLDGLFLEGNIPLISEADSAWFVANVPTFRYYSGSW
jgi:hypothetical protein